MSPHQRMMLKTMLVHIDFLTEQITSLDEEVARRLTPFQRELEILDSIPGVGQRTAEHILAEVGTDVASRFPSAPHLCSWAGMVPGQNESAGKRKASKTRKGNKYLRSSLTEVANSLSGSDNFLGAQYRRIAARKGKKRAAITVAHSILRIVYYLMTRKEEYKELGSNYYEKRQEEALVKRTIRRLEDLGYAVSITAPHAS